MGIHFIKTNRNLFEFNNGPADYACKLYTYSMYFHFLALSLVK